EYQDRRRAFEACLAMLDRVLVTSSEQASVFEKRVTNPLRLHFLQRSRATIRADKPRARTAAVRREGLTFVALNIVNPAKGYEILTSAFAALARDFPGIQLNLYGLRHAVFPGIRQFGPYDDSDLDSMIADADFGILPSIWPEAFGYVGPEMLSRGLPVIASNVGAMPDYVADGENGLLFDPSKPRALEDAIRKLIADPDLRRRVWEGAAGGQRRYITIEEHLDRLTGLYDEVMAEGAAPLVSKT
ncbi:MAG TPA: glycosyltransferase family 4 protein, partial [Opitutaceae bacterium]|nr:glycosyltransferase family 4 protein [Opitutaceae bacterium]